MTAHGADMVVLRACYWCGEWPYTHKANCPVETSREIELRRLAESLLCAVPGA